MTRPSPSKIASDWTRVSSLTSMASWGLMGSVRAISRTIQNICVSVSHVPNESVPWGHPTAHQNPYTGPTPTRPRAQHTSLAPNNTLTLAFRGANSSPIHWGPLLCLLAKSPTQEEEEDHDEA